ncbi:MAG: hypothetical protein LAT84_02045 [Balneolia bacterium]|nr:hypothetical protein [Balneolia bacterium]
MRPFYLKSALVLSFCFLLFHLSSCDMITQERSGIDEQIDNLPPLIFNQIPFPGKGQPGISLKNNDDLEKFIVNYSTLNTTDKEKPYTYDRFEIVFPDEVLSLADGKTRTLKVSFTITTDDVRTDSRSNDDGDSIVRTANMIIPDHDIAESMVRAHLRTFQLDSFWSNIAVKNDLELDPEYDYTIRVLLPDESVSNRKCDRLVEEWFCEIIDDYLECYMAQVCYAKFEAWEGEGGGSDPVDPVDPGEPGGGTPPIGDDDDPCDEFGGGDDGEGDTGGGHDNDEDFLPRLLECSECDAPNPPGWCPVDDEEEEEEVCDTEDEIINHLGDQGVLNELWELSNYTDNEFDRLEQGGWIVDAGNGNFVFHEFGDDWLRNACRITHPAEFDIPEGTVAMIHTHPYTVGEEMWACLNVPQEIIDLDPDGFSSIVKKYNNNPSDHDINFLNSLSSIGVNIDGYILDKNGIIKYDKNSTVAEVDLYAIRCGY